MIEPSLACQIAIRSALVAAPAVTDLVSAANIFDRTVRPEIMPCIVVGDGQTVLEPLTLSRSHVRIFSDIHIFSIQENGGLEKVKAIAGNVAAVLHTKPLIEGLTVIDWKLTGTRFLRDPGDQGHAIVSLELLVRWTPDADAITVTIPDTDFPDFTEVFEEGL